MNIPNFTLRRLKDRPVEFVVAEKAFKLSNDPAFEEE